jgi:hypothetical protein
MMEELDLYVVLDGEDLLGRLAGTSLFEPTSDDEGLLFGSLPCYISGRLELPGENIAIRRLELDVDIAVALMREDVAAVTDKLWELATRADLPLLFVSGGPEASYWSSADLTTQRLVRSIASSLTSGRLAAIHPVMYAAERIASGQLAQRLCQLPNYFHRSQPSVGCMAWFAVLDDGGPGGVLEDPGLLHARALELVNR